MTRPRGPKYPGVCEYCQIERRARHQDHIIPRWQGGADDVANYQYLCANCHQDKTLDEQQSEAYAVFISKRLKIALSLPGIKAKVGIASQRSWADPISRQRRITGMTGKIRTPEHCENIRKALTGKPHSAERKAAISKIRKGRKWTEAHKLAARGKPWWSAARRKASLK